VITNTADLMKTFLIDRTDGTPYGLIGKTLELCLSPYPGAPSTESVLCTTDNNMLRAIDDRTLGWTIPVDTMKTLVARMYHFDLIEVLSRSPNSFNPICSADVRISPGTTGAA